jgi:NTE family protein
LYDQAMTTALILGSGGSTAVAWELGVLAGAAAEGLDLTAVDLIVGTSAGAVVGANLASRADLQRLYESQLHPLAMVGRPMSMRAKIKYGWAAGSSRSSSAARSKLGRLAQATEPIDESERRAIFEARLSSLAWPERQLVVTAVDVESGELTTFSSISGVSLVDAIIASCALPGVWPPKYLNGRFWMDGATRSSTNADLAKDCDRIIIVAPVTRGVGAMPGVAPFVEKLHKLRRRVILVTPGPAAALAISQNLLYGARSARSSAARAGYAQAKSAVSAIRGLVSS